MWRMAEASPYVELDRDAWARLAGASSNGDAGAAPPALSDDELDRIRGPR